MNSVTNPMLLTEIRLFNFQWSFFLFSFFRASVARIKVNDSAVDISTAIAIDSDLQIFHLFKPICIINLHCL